MSLSEHLARVTRLEELPGLARELGLEPAWHEVDLGPLLSASRDPVARAALVGRRDSFLCLGLETAGRERVVRAVCRSMASRGTVGLALGLDPVARVLAIGVAAADCPSLTVDLAEPRPMDLRKLERGIGPADSGLARAMAWAEALSGRGLGTRFFQQFRRTLDQAIGALPRTIPRRDRHALGLLQLTRVLFLYFVQDQGWLDGRTRFLREELDRRLSGRGRVHRRFLHPLFFGTLNRKPADRSRAVRDLGRIPFLNGGLFDPHALERRWPSELPDQFWRSAFDDLFEHYHFTLREGDSPAAIGPDMLGRVFEGVMDPDERRDSGAFYTPASLVDRLIAAAFDSWQAELGLEPGLPEGSPPAPLAEAARSVLILDPAVGSGAFLLGAFKRLVSIRVAAGEPVATAARTVVTTNLFGVDRNPNAVRLAELRLWLQVIEAQTGAPIERIDPLPNLDAFVRQGDSLFEPFQAAGGADSAGAAALARCRAALAHASGPGKRERQRELRRAELRAAAAGLERTIGSVEHQIRELVDLGKTPGLFGQRAGLTRAQGAEVGRLRAERSRLRRLERRLRDRDELPWFQYGAHFGEVMARGGFDLVVGNPPWIRAESIPPNERAALKARYRWYRAGPGGAPGYRHQPDLSVAFVERGLELVRPGGTVGFLVPAKLATAQYAAPFRSELTRRTTIAVAADLTETAKDAFDATVYPLALVTRRAPPPETHRIRTALGERAPELRQSALGESPWSLGSEPAGPAGARHPTLGSRFVAHLGVKTGADRIFLDPPADGLTDLLRPAIRGRDVRPFLATPGRSILWTHDAAGRPVEILPDAARRYLERHERVLRRRADHSGEKYWQVFRVNGAIARHRVVWADLGRELRAAALVGPLARAIPLNTCYVVLLPDDHAAIRLAAWLNGSRIRRLARERATRAASGFARFDAATVGSLPLPDPVLDDPVLLGLGTRARAGADVQSELDARVDELLGDHR